MTCAVCTFWSLPDGLNIRRIRYSNGKVVTDKVIKRQSEFKNRMDMKRLQLYLLPVLCRLSDGARLRKFRVTHLYGIFHQ